MHKNLIVVCDGLTRFEGEAIATIVRKDYNFKTANTFWSSVDAGSLSETFLKISNIGDAFVFLCVTTDPIFKKIKVCSFSEEIKNVCLNIKNIGCTPIVCFNYFETEDMRKKKMRHTEKVLIKMCTDENIYFIRTNLLNKGEYFFTDEGKNCLVEKISAFCKSKQNKIKVDGVVADSASPKEVARTDKSIIMKKARKVIT